MGSNGNWKGWFWVVTWIEYGREISNGVGKKRGFGCIFLRSFVGIEFIRYSSRNNTYVPLIQSDIIIPTFWIFHAKSSEPARVFWSVWKCALFRSLSHTSQFVKVDRASWDTWWASKRNLEFLILAYTNDTECSVNRRISCVSSKVKQDKGVKERSFTNCFFIKRSRKGAIFLTRWSNYITS